MSFSWGKVEAILADVLKFGTELAAIAAPVVDVTNPGISGLYNLSVNAAMQAEEAGCQAASTQTTNAAKLAAITAAVTPYLLAAARQAGVNAPTTAKIAAYAQSVLNGLEILSASTTPAATT